MKTLSFTIIIGLSVASIIAGSFFFYTNNHSKSPVILSLPYATLTIARLDNSIVPSGTFLPFQPFIVNASLPQSQTGSALLEEAINYVNAVYNETSNKCRLEGKLTNGYCDDEGPISATYNMNITRQNFDSLGSDVTLKFLNSTKSWMAYIYYKNPQCYALYDAKTGIPKKDGFCYYDISIVKNQMEEGSQ